MYFEARRVISDGEKIAYTKSLLRDAAAKWITPYAEGSRQETWTTWDGFVDPLKRQFAEVDAENTPRTKIESMTQGVKTFTDYWNEFRLMATEANYDNKTMQILLIRGSNRVILDAWAQDNRRVVDVDDLAQWTIEKENRINFVKPFTRYQQRHERTIHHGTQMGHTDQQIAITRTIGIQWNWMQQEDDHGSTSQEGSFNDA